jgi:hypothetical protein
MSKPDFYTGTHPLEYKFKQLWNASFNPSKYPHIAEELEAFSHVEFVCLDHYKSGCFGGFEGAYSAWKKLDSWVGDDFMNQVKYWYDNDVEVSDEDAERWITDTIENILDNIGFDYDEPKNPAKRKRDEAKAKLDQMFKVARAEPAKKRRVTKPYKCSKCGQPKKGHSCKGPKKAKVTEFAVTEAEFRQYQAYQRCRSNRLPQWFISDDTKASDIFYRYDQLAAYYK